MIEVDIVVPVFKGLDATQRCLDSVIRFSQNTSFEIVVINDASPEPALVDYLEQLEAQHRISLIHNPVNRGFVCSANLGMMQHPNRDICLLNSDTEVHGDWLDRLRRSAYALEDIGTVTPFSNNATICSYPCFCEDNALPEEWSLSELDDLCAKLNAGQSIEIPTAVGFCMYVTRRCLEQTGYFDEVSFKRGYGEENDFCRRANAIGFSHRLATDTFVYHQGSVSFGHERIYLSQQAMAVIENRYPDYGALIAAHVAADPARMARRRVDLARLLRSPKPRLLLITHKLLGGTEKHIQDLAQLLESEYETLILRPGDQDQVILRWGRRNEEFQLYFRLPTEFDDLSDLLKVLCCSRIHFHHLIGFPPLIATLPTKLAVPYDYTVHDHFAICPQFNLTSVDGRYCGEPDEAGCNACLAQRPAPWRLDIASWRAFFSALLRGAARVFVPSQDTLERHRNYLPDVDFQYLPHPELRQFRVLVLGRLSAAKGGWQLEYCARDAKRRKLPLFFYVLGSAEYGPVSHEETVQNLTGLPLTFNGSYEDSMLSTLIAIAQADVIYFPAQGPETYSYTLSAALSTGLPIVAPSLGAFSERLAEYPHSCLISWDTPPAQVNNLLLKVIQTYQHWPIGRNETKSSLAYLDMYRVTVDQPAHLNPVSLFETVHRFTIHRRICNTLLEQPLYLLERNRLLAVFDDLIELSTARNMTVSDVLDWKNHLLSEVLRLQQEINQQQQEINQQQQEENRQLQLLHDKISHYCGEIDQQQIVIEDLEEKLAVRDIEIHRLNNQFSFLQQKIVELQASTSWKITAPLRWMRTVTKSIYSGYWIQLIHKLRAIICGDRRFFFNLIIKYRKKTGNLINKADQNFPNFSGFFLKPLVNSIKNIFRPFARNLFYKFFNDMLYEVHSMPVYSKEFYSKDSFLSLPNFNPSEHFKSIDSAFNPKVTVIVPNYNHSQFLQKRLDSIYQQTYQNFDIILLDDYSSDNSREVLSNYACNHAEIPTRICFSDKNSGHAFLQWKKGIKLTDSSIIWIAESDDFCNSDFLETLVPFFMDETVFLAYARSVFIGADNQPTIFAFDDYLSEIDTKKWLNDYVESAHNEIIEALGKKNTIPNISSALFRNPRNCPLLKDENWLNMKICGDWIFYLHLIRGAKIAFTNRTLNYYRFHSANSSAETYQKAVYYQEHYQVAKTIAQLYNVPDIVLSIHQKFVRRFWEQNMNVLNKNDFDELYNIQEVPKLKSKRLPNILIASYAFSTGGGEIFPIRLANELKLRGYGITFFNFNREPANINVRKMLSNDIPVFECTARMGNLDQILSDFGIEIVHTHHVSTEHFFATYMKDTRKTVKHIATMHGMYETLEDIHVINILPSIVKNIDLWIYIADKNLDLFKLNNCYNEEKFIKISNGMEPPEIHPITRESLDIPDSAFILCQASRAMPEKGWEEAVKIVTEARALCQRDIHLLLLGDGPVYEFLLAAQQLPDYIHLLGFRNNPVDYYAMSNMGFLPSRFRGESFPLSVIECLFAGRPLIASDIGEIRNMLTLEEGMAGATFPLDRWEIPVAEVAKLVTEFAVHQEIYEKAQSLALKAASRFHISNVIDDYEKIYKRLYSITGA